MTRTPFSLLALAIAGSFAVAACGGAAPTVAPATPAPTVAPTATQAPTPSPTVAPSPSETPAETPTDAPSAANGSLDPALGGFAFSPKDILDYYQSTGFTCEDPYPSDQAAGYTVERCLVEGDNGLIQLVALVINDQTGAIGNGFAAVLRRPGQTMPTTDEAAGHLGGFTTAMLGSNADGIEAAKWVGTHLGEAQQTTTVRDILLGTYTTDDETGIGIYVEVANQDFQSAPKP